MKKSLPRFLSLFFLSAALIGYEISIMRTFAVGSWSNFGAMVISIALLGFGLAGTLLVFLQKSINSSPGLWLKTSALGFVPAMVLAHIVAQLVPFKPQMIAIDLTQVLWIGVYYLTYMVPFFIGAVFINVVFIIYREDIPQLYFWNMTGSGLGGVLILFSMYLFPPDKLLLPLILIAALAVALVYLGTSDGAFKIPLRGLVISLAVLLLSALAVLGWGGIKVSKFKGISVVRTFSDVKPAQPDYYSYGPEGEFYVYSSASLHFAPGLSEVAAFNVPEYPTNAFKGLFIDGAGPIGIMKKLKESAQAYIYFLPMTAPYLVLEKPRVMLARLGGGISTFTALYHDSSCVDVVEPNPALIKMMRDDPVISTFDGKLLANPKINLIENEPRAYSSATQNRYDLVELSLIDSVGISQAEPYPIDENYIYTVEAITDYMNCLNDAGILSITVWNKLRYPRNVPKLLTTIVESLHRQKLAEPQLHLFMFDNLYATATVLVKKTPFSTQEVEILKKWVGRMAFNLIYYPGISESDQDFTQILAQFWAVYQTPKAKTEGPTAGKTGGINQEEPDAAARKTFIAVNPNDVYQHMLFWLLGGRAEELYKKYVFDIRPATDARPYYTAYLKPATLGMYLDKLDKIPEEWGYLLLVGTLLQSLFFGLVIVFVPLLGRWQELFAGKKGTLGIILYYSCLGLGYMMIEIFLMQRLVYFLAQPIYSVSIVLTSMLIISALGSLFSGRIGWKKPLLIKVAVTGIAASVLFYLFLLTPIINHLIGLPLLYKSFIAILVIAPAAFFMGIPYPTGLSALKESRPGLIPWALGMNGALSVTGSVASKLLSISFGFSVVLVIAGLIYLGAGAVFAANLVGNKD